MDEFMHFLFGDQSNFPIVLLYMIAVFAISMICGGVIGYERGRNDRPAGLRTHILVCTGSALVMLISIHGFDGLPFPNRDPARLAAQVVSGIGFLGAGTIIREGMTIKGLTTAASLWMVSAIGLTLGAGQIILGVFATCIVYGTLTFLHRWEKNTFATTFTTYWTFTFQVKDTTQTLEQINAVLLENKVKVHRLTMKDTDEKGVQPIEIYAKVNKTLKIVELLSKINAIENVVNAKVVKQ